MKRIFISAALLGLFCLPVLKAAAGARIVEPFDANWLFLKADATNAGQISFDDSGWRKLSVPHDWSIEGPFSETNKVGGAGAFLPSGVAWYRKHFLLPEDLSNCCVFIQFDGVMANSDVWINGFHLGHRPYGYVSFDYELTGHLHSDGDNVLAVRCDNSQQPASRWYAGAGIYRHVRLVITDPIHIEHWGEFISTPEISASKARVKIQTRIQNESSDDSNTHLITKILDPNGNQVAMQEHGDDIDAHKEDDATQTFEIISPKLWSLDSPVLYTAVTEIWVAGKIVDQSETKFGIRDAHFDAATGFWLNGKNFKIKGVCLHACASAFGAAVPLSVWEERLKTLKLLGVNAIRTAHNPPAPEFLDLCDRMGFLVMDEFFDCWTVGKNPYDYHLFFNDWSQTDERATILRDRNHPGIIIYSVGNEIHDTPHAEMAKHILAGLLRVAHETDPTRPVTMALFRPNASHDYDDGLADMLDVVGQNYRENEILAAHEQKPSRKILGTENHPGRAAWLALHDNPPYAGQFLWSGIDYLGESRRWPVIAAGSGLLDRTGEIKPIGYEQASWWSDKPMVFIARRIVPVERVSADPGFTPLDRRQVLFPDWTPQNLKPHQETIEVYSNCKQVELFLNGKSLGAQKIHPDASPRVWQITFAPGTLKAVAKNDGNVVATDVLRTAGKPAKIVLTTNRKKLSDDWNDVAFVRAEIADKHGALVPSADNLISFQISEPGEIAAVDSADNSSHEPFQSNQRRAYEGKCVAFVKTLANSGRIVVTANAPRLKSGKIVIQTGQ